MSRADRIALLISLVALLVSAYVTDRVFERIPHIEDEMAYTWQAQVIARGQIALPAQKYPKSMLVPFVVDYNGLRFSKYPLGWPVVLAIGIKLGIRHLINPILAGIAVWLTYQLGKKVFSAGTGLLAGVLTISSPFFLMNSGSLLSHPWSLFLTLAFTLAWMDTFNSKRSVPRWLTILTASFSLGALILTRPMTAFAVCIPFMIHGLILLWRGNNQDRRAVIIIGTICVVIAALHPLWQYALTGDPLLNPYSLWWPYDKVGFGPGHGRQDGGYQLHDAWKNLKDSLWFGRHDLFGWGSYSWIFLPFGLWSARRNHRAWQIAGIFISLLLVYMLYWIGSYLLGPRYYYEGLFCMTLFSAAGIIYLSGLPLRNFSLQKKKVNWRVIRAFGVITGVALLMTINLRYYTPARVGGMYGLYGINQSRLAPFTTQKAQELTPALIIVHPQKKWTEYGALLDLQNALYDSPFIFAYSRAEDRDNEVANGFPSRAIFHYYPDEPLRFYTAPRIQ